MLSADFFWRQLIPALNDGLLFSLSLILPAALMGLAGGVAVGAARVYAPPPLRRLADGYVAVIRGVPLLLQLYFLYFALPQWLDIRLSPYQAAVLGFTLCNAAYHSEYIRGALLSLRKGQILAAYALGFSTLDMVLFVAVPQALRRALPGCGNEFIYLIKYSSLAYLLTFIELTGTAKALTIQSLRHTEVYFTVGMYYLAMVTAATWLLRWCERRAYIPGFGEKK